MKPRVFLCIPARFSSKRLPGKPLIDLGGKTMLERVVEVAQKAGQLIQEKGVKVTILVATDNDDVAQHCRDIGVQAVSTDPDITSGSDRVYYALDGMAGESDIVINLQGDAPFTPPNFLDDLSSVLTKEIKVDVATVVKRLSWSELDTLRKNKVATPFSGTTVIVDSNQNAIWFSKNIIPAIRGEEELRSTQNLSPVIQHIGVYGYRYQALARFCSLPQSKYEVLEQLEQLRFIEDGVAIKCVFVTREGDYQLGGIDSPEDAQKAIEQLKSERH